jgi:4-hydroxybenzoate polyprenyltransferase
MEPIAKVVFASLAGASLHWATVLINNLTDRQSDSLHPRKQNLAIVAGRITSTQATVTIVASFALYLGMLFATAASCGVVAYFVPLAALQVYVNIFQKRSKRVPPMVMDFLFGVTVGFPAIAYPLAQGRVASASEVFFALTLVIDAAVLNIVVGNLKDLPWDLEADDATTAISLGVRPDAHDSTALRVTSPYLAVTSFLLLVRTGLIGLIAASWGRSTAWSAPLVVVSLVGLAMWVRAPVNASLVPNARYGYLFVATNFSTLFAAALLTQTTATMVAVIAGIVVLAPTSGALVSRLQRWRPTR